MIGLLAVGLLLASAGIGLAADPVVSLKTRGEVSLRFVLLKPERPVAAVILFSGGHGKVPLDRLAPGQFVNRGNFLVRTRYEFTRRGLMVAVVDAPSDRQESGGMLGTFRGSDEHTQDITAVVDYLKAQADVPVWLIGTSRGTESAAALATKLGNRIGGVVLTSSMSMRNRQGFSVFEFPLKAIRVPALVVSHKDDGCQVTPPSQAERIAGAMSNSPRTKVLLVEGGDPPRSDPCEALSQHGFIGIEKQVVAAIADFIKAK
jgi:alpha-beta hydrolase superfamily lysophospholipase